MKHILFYNPKGGACKSTLCYYVAHHLETKGLTVQIQTTDRQKHVKETGRVPEADFGLWDMTGAHTYENKNLLNAALNSKDVLVVVPISTGKNDFSELRFTIQQLEQYDLKKRAQFVLTKTRPNTKIIKERLDTLHSNNLNVMSYTMPLWEDFNQLKNTAKTRNSISKFVLELLGGDYV